VRGEKGSEFLLVAEEQDARIQPGGGGRRHGLDNGLRACVAAHGVNREGQSPLSAIVQIAPLLKGCEKILFAPIRATPAADGLLARPRTWGK
jgi:hypothetical protein